MGCASVKQIISIWHHPPVRCGITRCTCSKRQDLERLRKFVMGSVISKVRTMDCMLIPMGTQMHLSLLWLSIETHLSVHSVMNSILCSIMRVPKISENEILCSWLEASLKAATAIHHFSLSMCKAWSVHIQRYRISQKCGLLCPACAFTHATLKPERSRSLTVFTSLSLSPESEWLSFKNRTQNTMHYRVTCISFVHFDLNAILIFVSCRDQQCGTVLFQNGSRLFNFWWNGLSRLRSHFGRSHKGQRRQEIHILRWHCSHVFYPCKAGTLATQSFQLSLTSCWHSCFSSCCTGLPPSVPGTWPKNSNLWSLCRLPRSLIWGTPLRPFRLVSVDARVCIQSGVSISCVKVDTIMSSLFEKACTNTIPHITWSKSWNMLDHYPCISINRYPASS